MKCSRGHQETRIKTLNRHMFKALPIIPIIIAITVISDEMSPTIQSSTFSSLMTEVIFFRRHKATHYSPLKLAKAKSFCSLQKERKKPEMHSVRLTLLVSQINIACHLRGFG